MNNFEIHIIPGTDGTLAVKMPYDELLLNKIRAIPGRRWESETKTWHIPNRKKNLDVILLSVIKRNNPTIFIGSKPLSGILENHQDIEHPLIRLRQELTIRKYSRSTIKSYIHYNRQLLIYSGKKPDDMIQPDIESYLYSMGSRDIISASTLSAAINALKFYYGIILKRKFIYGIKSPRKDKKLPLVLSRQEVFEIFNNTINLKHKTILMLIYSAGLRLNESITLKISNVDLDRKIISVRSGKGRKDRTTLLSEKFSEILLEYLSKYRPDKWLFEGQYKDNHISARSIQNVFQRALTKSGIKKAATVHTLRQSFATHLLEQGVDIRYIQELPGHKKPEYDDDLYPCEHQGNS